MIVALSYSINLLGNDCTISSTGGLEQDSISSDSVLISYDDLRIVNSKLIELEYEKEINRNLKGVISNDSIIISGLNDNIRNAERRYNENLKKVKKERNIATGISFGTIVLLIISLL